jgi:glycosyltransferase involved in cell wall biosynthesis
VTRPLRICFAAYRGNMQCGGQGVYLWFLARELAALGHDVDVLVGPPYPDPMPFASSVTRLPDPQFWAAWFARDRAALLPAGRPLAVFEPLHFYELAASYLGFLPEPLAFSLRALRRVAARVAAGRRWDVVHDVQCLGWGMLGIHALGLPVVSTIHHPLSVDRRASFVRDRNLREAIGTMAFYPIGMQASVARRIERVFTSSRASAERIARDFGVRRERLCMLANGVDTELYRPDPQVLRDPNEILCVGRASDPNKGVATLVEALARLPARVRLTLVDDPHPDNGARVRARELGCADRLDVVGRVPTERLLELYRRAALVAVPSRYEGFGLPAAEAMACGTPVVATSAGGLPEVVSTGGGGVLVPKDDPEALAAAIGDLLERPEARAELGARGRRGIAEAYSWPRIARATAEVYAQVVAERRGRPESTTTSARAGARRAIQSSAPSAARPTAPGRCCSERLQPGMPQASDTPSKPSSSSHSEACSRIRPSS